MKSNTILKSVYLHDYHKITRCSSNGNGQCNIIAKIMSFMMETGDKYVFKINDIICKKVQRVN